MLQKEKKKTVKCIIEGRRKGERNSIIPRRTKKQKDRFFTYKKKKNTIFFPYVHQTGTEEEYTYN